jgi:DNA-directed RNA polymerase alpha subunit
MYLDNKIKQLIAKHAAEGMTLAELEYLGLSYRIISMLETKLDILYLSQLLQYSQKDILQTNQIGRENLKHVFQALMKIESFEERKKAWNFVSNKTEAYKKKKSLALHLK